MCSLLDNPRNGTVVVDGFSAGDAAVYSCNEGFELVGEMTRVCMNNTQWSGEAPECTLGK